MNVIINKIMSAIVNKHRILSYDYEEMNNAQLEKEIYQQIT